MGKQLYCWDFTIHVNETFAKDDHAKLITQLKEICKAGNFQLEEGEKCGKLHFQGRVSLKKKRRKTEIYKLATDTFLTGVHWSPTSNENKGNFDYVTKNFTRIAGPWDINTKPRYIPRQVREMGDLRPFQKAICDDAEVWNTRSINIVYDPVGNIGKSRLKLWLRAYGIGRTIPPVNDFKDMMRMVMDMPTSKLYLIDMPKAYKKDKLGGLYSAIETIKDGYAYDDRYHFQEKIFDCPNIWVFTNTLPDLDLLSKDRWVIWGVTTDTYDLYKYDCENE